jgi:glutathionylspermidine synthase
MPGSSDASELDYGAFAGALTESGILSDPWLDGKPRFRARPTLLVPDQLHALYAAAEQVTAALHELVLLCVAEPELAARYFGLTSFQHALFAAQAPLWHGIARADVFFTADGLRVCELNCDTPSGQAEAVLLGQEAVRRFSGYRDPNHGLGERYCALVETMGRAAAGAHRALSIGIVYPTELTEDLSMIALYQRWLRARGHTVTLGSPFNLRPCGARDLALLGVRCDVLIRHYKTDWWCERLPSFVDDAYADAEPLYAPLAYLLSSLLARRCAVVNPTGALIPQNKRALAFLWEEIDRFSPTAQSAIRRYIPYTARLELLPIEELSAHKDEWVLKSDYGCEGSEVFVGSALSQEDWDDALARVVPSRFVAQRYFAALPDATGAIPNFGIYLVAGQAAGVFTRVAFGPTDRSALSVATLVEAP